MTLVMVIRCENKITLLSQALIQKIGLPSLVFCSLSFTSW